MLWLFLLSVNLNACDDFFLFQSRLLHNVSKIKLNLQLFRFTLFHYININNYQFIFENAFHPLPATFWLTV